MRAALLAVLLLAAPGLATLPEVGDGNGDGLPDAVRWAPPPLAACWRAWCGLAEGALDAADTAGGDLLPDTADAAVGVLFDGPARAWAGGSLAALPGSGDLPQPVAHAGDAGASLGACVVACAGVRAATFYGQAQGRQPDITLHGLPEAGATGFAGAGLGPVPTAGRLVARLGAPFRATMTDAGNATVVAAEPRHEAQACAHRCVPLAGGAGVELAWLVLLIHDRGYPHHWLGIVAPRADQCVGVAGCAGAALNHSARHYDADDDVIHEESGVGWDDGAALACALPGCAAGARLDGAAEARLEDMFWVVRPPQGASGEARLGAAAEPPFLALPPAAPRAEAAFAARDADRDGDLDEAYAEACVEGSCTRVG